MGRLVYPLGTYGWVIILDGYPWVGYPTGWVPMGGWSFRKTHPWVPMQQPTCDKTAKHLGGYYDPVLWNRIIFQTSKLGSSIRHGVIEIGALEMTKSRMQQLAARTPSLKAGKPQNWL